MTTITAKIAEAEAVLLEVWREVLPVGDRRAELFSKNGAQGFMTRGGWLDPCLFAGTAGVWDNRTAMARSLDLKARLKEIRAS